MNGLLEHLQQEHAFNPTPRQAQLGSLHVAFDELLNTRRVEERLRTALDMGGRVALIGDSGCGKSSVIWNVLDPLAERVAPISVPVAALPRETLLEPVTVADQLIRLLAQHAQRSQRVSEREERELLQSAQPERPVRVGRDSRAGFRWLGAELSTDLSRQTQGVVAIGPDEKLEVVEQLLTRIASADLVPVLVFDDTDRWVEGVGHDHPRKVVEAFFGRVLRWAAELRCGVVVAAHASYFADVADRRRLLEVVETEIEVPRLPDRPALARLFERRVEAATLHSAYDGASVAAAFTEGAIAALFHWYDHSGCQLREVVQAAHTALAEACDAGCDQITAPLIAAALAAR